MARENASFPSSGEPKVTHNRGGAEVELQELKLPEDELLRKWRAARVASDPPKEWPVKITGLSLISCRRT
jgi:hypothetical protein